MKPEPPVTEEKQQQQEEVEEEQDEVSKEEVKEKEVLGAQQLWDQGRNPERKPSASDNSCTVNLPELSTSMRNFTLTRSDS